MKVRIWPLDKLMSGEISEAQLVDSIIELAQTLGYHICHFRPALTAKGYRTAIQGTVGFPDLVIVGFGKVFAWECKNEKGKLTAEQQEWLREFLKAGASVGVIRPHDWLNDSVLEQLKAEIKKLE